MITRWAPVERFKSFERFNKMMEEFLGNGGDFPVGWMPTVDVKDTPKELTLIAELPGVNEKDIEVEVVGENLTIRGKREFNVEEKKDDYVRIERNYGSFLRTFALDVPVKPDKITANFKDGLLTVTVPKAEGIAPRKVAIHKG